MLAAAATDETLTKAARLAGVMVDAEAYTAGAPAALEAMTPREEVLRESTIEALTADRASARAEQTARG